MIRVAIFALAIFALGEALRAASACALWPMTAWLGLAGACAMAAIGGRHA